MKTSREFMNFFMVLNNTYRQTRSNILMIKTFPSVSTIYSILLLDEKQKDNCHIRLNLPPVLLCLMLECPSRVCLSRVFPLKLVLSLQRLRLFVNTVRSHDILSSYKLHGFPPNFKFNKSSSAPRNTASNVEVEFAANVHACPSTSDGSSNEERSFTQV